MNPYESPQSDHRETEEEKVLPCGKPCTKCGSANTSKGTFLRKRPNILFIILLGWIFILIQGAMAMRTEVCRDCGSVYRYKSTGSWIAMAVLIFLTVCFLLGVIAENHR